MSLIALLQRTNTPSLEVIRTLIEQGAGINETDREGRSALMWALGLGHTAIAQYLLEQGANADGFNPLDEFLTYAEVAQNSEMIELLLQLAVAQSQRAQPGSPASTRLVRLIKTEQFELASALLDRGFSPHEIDGEHWPLLLAVQAGRHELVTQLLAKGASADGQSARVSIEQQGEPLFAAIKCQHTELVKVLLVKGA